MLHTTYDRSQIFVGDNRYETGTYTNGTGSTKDLAKGTLMGRIHATGKLTPLASAASDGSQYPVGILADDYSVLDTASATVTICVAGDVVSSKIVLDGSDTLETVISARRIKDRIGADTVGIKLVATDELTGYDNA